MSYYPKFLAVPRTLMLRKRSSAANATSSSPATRGSSVLSRRPTSTRVAKPVLLVVESERARRRNNSKRKSWTNIHTSMQPPDEPVSQDVQEDTPRHRSLINFEEDVDWQHLQEEEEKEDRKATVDEEWGMYSVDDQQHDHQQQQYNQLQIAASSERMARLIGENPGAQLRKHCASPVYQNNFMDTVVSSATPLDELGEDTIEAVGKGGREQSPYLPMEDDCCDVEFGGELQENSAESAKEKGQLLEVANPWKGGWRNIVSV